MNMATPFSFRVPARLNAATPPEKRGIRRDHVRLMVLDRKTGRTQHDRFDQLDRYLDVGDVLVLNASRTVPASLRAQWRRGDQLIMSEVEVRLARRWTEVEWDVLVMGGEVQERDLLVFSGDLSGEVIGRKADHPLVRLRFSLLGPALWEELYRWGGPIRYEYVTGQWGLEEYQTVMASVPGSVEMPSAGRAFSWEMLIRLRRKGIKIAWIVLHTGLSYFLHDRWRLSPEDNWEEYRVPEETANMVNEAKRCGKRVIAVGTTVVRALETVSPRGFAEAGTGWTHLTIDQDYTLRITDGLLTGFHEPEASHLDLLSAFIRPDRLNRAYLEAVERGYMWHEFGDMNLIM
ncbi:S-adenosylmethionine:tRNA ribosyltransferase-isomerase [Polycladomyces subterraneus]|uniref:S-adenosylmethionine:tRNA ribosyltransferase-isomerase n=1 Tax=Polycladomyces subterraneus TaxID=1016997 RepID=A0ABT8IRV9_9BACL|nr:S-adenosylmethionine:tRNA ribosyltransferase-isomerase [Polycladomyces subterraneus]MDN4595507.1 S-adenosylmethionine:tRNA ribosyltransferase-isomerase [Polycladomyces subterraneus]